MAIGVVITILRSPDLIAHEQQGYTLAYHEDGDRQGQEIILTAAATPTQTTAMALKSPYLERWVRERAVQN